MVQNYKDLLVWQKAMELTKLVYMLTKKLPKDELYGLTNQVRRAAVSIPSNIAEGHCRNSIKEYINFLGIANGSNAETETQLLLCVELGYLSEDDISEALDVSDHIARMLNVLIGKLKN